MARCVLPGCGRGGAQRVFLTWFVQTPVLKKEQSSNFSEFQPLRQTNIQCIIKGRPASEGGSNLWSRRHSVSLDCNRKTERSGCVMGRKAWAVPSDGGFAPAPPGFIAWVPVPMRGLDQHLVEKGCRSIPPRSVEATESALGLLPSMALSSAQLRLIITAAGAGRALPSGSWSMALYLGGKIHVDTNHLPPKEATRHE